MTGEHPQPSLLRRAATTPLSEVLRLSGSLDWKHVIVDSELPPSVQDLCAHITRRTRLWRREKVEVARELTAHFRDAIEAGRTPEQAIDSFGNSNEAAKLIRRAKKRTRGPAWKSLIYTRNAFVAFIALVVLVYGWSAARFYFDSPRITRNVSAELNAAAPSAPEGQRAWEIYREAVAGIPLTPEPLLNAKTWPVLTPDSPVWDDALAYHETTLPALERVRTATKLPVLGYVVDDALDPVLTRAYATRRGIADDTPPEGFVPSDNPEAYAILLEPLGLLREYLRLFWFDARLAAMNDDGARFFDDVDSVLALGEHAGQMQALIADLVRLSLLDASYTIVGDMLAEHPDLLTDDQLRDLAHTLVARGGPMRVSLEFERAAFEDMIQRTYSPGDDGRLTSEGLELLVMYSDGIDVLEPARFEEAVRAAGGPVFRMLLADRAHMLARYEYFMDGFQRDMDRPLWDRARILELERELEETHGDITYWPVHIFVPAISRAVQRADFTSMRRDSVLVAIALELHKRRTGAYPDSLEQLVPALLPSIPVDVFTGDPLGYALTDDGPVVYSRGTDLDDDGGAPPPAGFTQDAVRQWRHADEVAALQAHDPRRIPDADWVLWPRPDETPD